MRHIYYILTTEREMLHFERKSDAVAEFNRLAEFEEHLRLERANDAEGTARVIKAKNNIW
jgi:hypothetical protein